MTGKWGPLVAILEATTIIKYASWTHTESGRDQGWRVVSQLAMEQGRAKVSRRGSERGS